MHRDTVRQVLAQSCVLRPQLTPRPSQADAYLPFILETLKQFPTLAASRLHVMVRERGYAGGADYFRHFVARHRPRPVAEAYLRLRTLPGEQAQADWAHCGHLMIGRAKRPLMAFVMVLSYSRRIFLRFSLNARMDSFQRGHVLAMQTWGGVPRVVWVDNLKSAVLERAGDAIRFNPQMLAFAAHYRFELRPVAVARGNEKGRVERSIRYIRDAFLAARALTDVDDLNAQALQWCESEAATRRWPQDDSLDGGPSLLAGAAQPDGAARTRVGVGRAAAGGGGQDALRPLRPQRLLRSPHACAAHRHRAGRSRACAHPGRRDPAGHPPAQL